MIKSLSSQVMKSKISSVEICWLKLCHCHFLKPQMKCSKLPMKASLDQCFSNHSLGIHISSPVTKSVDCLVESLEGVNTWTIWGPEDWFGSNALDVG